MFAVSLGLPLIQAASPVVISEFMAKNATSLKDEDGDPSDWIELHNVSNASVDLANWSLSDNAGNLQKWQLPATNIAAQGYLVVFASGKNRGVPGQNLHTSFQLSASGEYLALTMPDGVTIASQFSPTFPEQYEDISYGQGMETTTSRLLSAGAAARYLIPQDGTLGTNWAQRSFNDASWQSAKTGIGFDAGPVQSTTHLFAYWPIQEGSGTVASNLVNGGENGVIKNAQWITNDPERGTVLSFNGESSYASAGTIPRMGQSTSNFTWSFWYKQNSVPNENAVILGNRSGGASGAVQFIKFTPSNFEYYHDGDVGFIAHAIPTGSWRHLVVVKNGATLTYYDNASVVGTSTVSADIEANPFFWGGDPDVWGENANGLIDDVSLWTTDLTEAQVKLLYQGTSPAALTGIGGAIASNIEKAMLGKNASAYLRLPFTVNEGVSFNTLSLLMRYDDGFIAYLNGTEVARRNAPASAVWNSMATAEHAMPAAGQVETIDLSNYVSLLVPGTNVLAIHGLNLTASDMDFLILPELEGKSVTVAEGRFFHNPTPGTDNELGFLGFVADTKFDHDRGFYDAPFQLNITCATPGVTVMYTTNGTEPSLTHGTVYQGPITIDRTTVLRVGAYKEGYESMATEAQTYIFLNQVLVQNGAGYPNNWGNDWAMDPRVVTNALYAGRIRDDMKSLPVVSIAMDSADFWGPDGVYTLSGGRGEDYERPCSAEMFFPDGSRKGFQVNCGIQIVGSASRSMTPKHGIGLTFKAKYGPTKLKYRFFDDSQVDEFDFLAFRPNFNMSWVRTDNSGPLNNGNADGAERTHAIYVRDQFTKESQLAMGQPSAHERFVHLYVNGLYWGLYNPSERTDASFAASYMGGEKEEYDAIFSDPSTIARAKDGDKNAWNAMMSIARQGLSTPEAYAQIKSYVNVTNLADYMMLNFYCSTVDWPWQNWNAARKRETNGQFHFFVWDAEYTLETPPWVPEDRTGVGADSSEADSPAYIYNQLRQNAEWRLLFADRAHKHFLNDGAMSTNQATQRFLKLCDTIDRAIVCESARWGDVVRQDRPYTRDIEWVIEKNRLLTQFFPQRSSRMLLLFIGAGLYPTVVAPEFNLPGGEYNGAIQITMRTTVGTIYYTTNGTDPRLTGGAISPDAKIYTGPVTLSGNQTIIARVRQANTWSASNVTTYTVTQPPVLSVTYANGTANISWPVDCSGFVLESAPSLPATEWTPVAGVVSNQTTVIFPAENRFFRLRKE